MYTVRLIDVGRILCCGLYSFLVHAMLLFLSCLGIFLNSGAAHVDVVVSMCVWGGGGAGGGGDSLYLGLVTV